MIRLNDGYKCSSEGGGSNFFSSKFQEGDKVSLTIDPVGCNCSVSVNGSPPQVIFESHKFSTLEFYPAIRLGYQNQCLAVQNETEKIDHMVKEADFNSMKQKLAAEKQQLQDEVNYLIQEDRNSKAIIEQKCTEISNLEAAITDLKLQLADKNQQITDFQADIQELKTQHNNLMALKALNSNFSQVMTQAVDESKRDIVAESKQQLMALHNMYQLFQIKSDIENSQSLDQINYRIICLMNYHLKSTYAIDSQDQDKTEKQKNHLLFAKVEERVEDMSKSEVQFVI